MKKIISAFTLVIFLCVPNFVFSQWQLIHTFPSAPVNMEVVDTTMYVVTGLNGLYASYDNGQTWIQKNNNISDTIIRAFYADTSILMAPVGGNGGGINISTDGGNSWSVSSAGINIPYGIFSVAKSGNNLLCGTFGTFALDSAVLYLSTNNGSTWTPLVTITWTSGFPAIAVKDSFVVASTYSGEFYYSTDFGVTWTSVSTPFASEDMVITNSSIVAAASNVNSDIRYSLDNGMSWQVGEDTIAAEDFKRQNDTVYAATLKGFHYSFDAGMNWQQYNVGLPVNKQCYAVGVKGGDLFLGHQTGELYKLSLAQLTSINEQQNNFSLIDIFPNPVNTYLDINPGGHSYFQVEIVDSFGRKILSQDSIEKRIYIGDFAKGIYFIRVYDKINSITRKIIIQ